MVLLYGGFNKTKALFFNFLSSLVAIAGTLFGYYFAKDQRVSCVLLPLAAGGFIYIASCDLIPELHGRTILKDPLLRWQLYFRDSPYVFFKILFKTA